ncbi:MAG: aminotransferase [Proteobacteria bacterium]|nr:aminotransferase [Pseudomonadota bacterium]
MTTNQPLQQRSEQELSDQLSQWQNQYQGLGGGNLKLDLSRGKPGVEQVSLSDGLDGALQGNYIAEDGTDTRNYGGLRGIAEARALGAELMGVPAANVMAAGNSSLSIMHLVMRTAMDLGLWNDGRLWTNTDKPKILAPVPGYDRHFSLTDHFGIELIPIPMNEDGPDMQAASAAAADPSVKGIWCVPKYANPTGCTYSDKVVAELAALPGSAAAADFVVLWDNAYAVHDLYDEGDTLASVFDATATAGTADHVVQFASTSKITHAGAGVAFVAGSETVLNALEHHLGILTVGPDKVNQLRHVRFLQGRLRAHMADHAVIMRPKFELVEDIFSRELAGLGIATWTKPKGGYFVSLDVNPGLARKIIAMAKAVGLTLTPAGATFPNGDDPQDKNIRIAPTFGSLEEIHAAMDILTLCIKTASAEQILAAH